MEHYAVESKLADAIFGPVLLCKALRMGNKLVAIKQVDLTAAARQVSADAARKVQEDNAMELAVYQAFRANGGHTHVLHLHETFDDANRRRHLVLDYCPGGDLYDAIISATALPLPLAQRYFRQVCQGLSFMHSCGFAHRDISLENVLVDANNHCKLIDFGLATPIKDATPSTSSVGKQFYMAPEVYQGFPYDPVAADMWSLGVLLFIMIVGSPPMEKPTAEDERFVLIHKDGIQGLLAAWKIDDRFSSDAVAVLDSLMCVQPRRRLTMSALLRHPFLQKELDILHPPASRAPTPQLPQDRASPSPVPWTALLQLFPPAMTRPV
ncbi:CAMK/CAMKL protein kinase [Aphanomyces invadans]|uniref:CAMK/CAMKL protein kinase n=1 Tax=Aphanomyces invadans TaxID=157072 RepID=A0A024UNV0_9STRA|nr:CAMK/CAMKL protein kinase [Aphanomyces invadans]ETW07308.1 CAMK/CAMKL protein kinase [Aphanomyces invadans]|eukprot:XP_008863401.1 CAMK/CAMKL protein kinase [Aphanomyces invadans]